MEERPYSYKPAPRFFGGGDTFLGVELEVIAPDYERKASGLAIETRPTWCYAKRDGSLPGTGWEMVTHPISMNFWMSSDNASSYRDYHNIQPGQVLTARYKGETYTATVREGGQVEWNGTVYSSISACGKAIRGGKSTNGYDFFGLTRDHQPNPVGNFFRLVEQLKELGYTSHDGGRCGFHVHVSRTAFSEDGSVDNERFFRFKCLVNGMLFRKLSQRDDFGFCQQEPVVRDGSWWRNRGRYSAVNLTEKTAEIRIFRGNLREKRLRKNIEAVIAVVEYAREATDWTAPTDEAFVAWVNAREDRFPNLVAYIEMLDGTGDR